MIIKTKFKFLQEFGKSFSFYTKPFNMGTIDSDNPIAIPQTPQTVPSLLLSTSRESEVETTENTEATIQLSMTRKKIITKQQEAVMFASLSLLGRKQSVVVPVISRIGAKRIIDLLIFFIFVLTNLPKSNANNAPKVFGMRTKFATVVQGIAKRLISKSFKFQKIKVDIQKKKTVERIIQNILGKVSIQLNLNYSSYYCYCSSPYSDLKSDQSFILFSFLVTITAIHIAEITARKSTIEAMYQGRLIDLVLSKIYGVMLTLMESSISGIVMPTPINISQFYEAYLAIKKPCIVYADEPAIPPMALIKYTPIRYPSGRKSNRMAIISSEIKLLIAITKTAICRGYLSNMIPIGISVIITGMNEQKYRRLISMEVRLYGCYLRGACKA